MTIDDLLIVRGICREDLASFTDSELLDLYRELEIEQCREDVSYYVRTYCVYEDKDADELVQRFDMWEAQEEALKSIHEHRLNVILKARQLGITWLVVSYASWLLRMRSGRTVIGLSRTEDEAMELVRRLSVEFRYMKALIREKGTDEARGWRGVTFETRSLKLVVHFPNEPDSVFLAFPSSPGSVRSFTADLVIFDEWAFQQWADQIWTSAAPTINRPGGGKFIGLSTNIRGSLFESKFTDNDNGFNKIFIPWFADPSRDQAWYDRTKAMMGGDITQEYPATIEEALSVSGGAYFPEVSVKTHITKSSITTHVRRYVSLDYGFDMCAAYWYAVDEKYNAQIYREFHVPNLTAAQAADSIRDLTGNEHIELYLAPPDLWNRQSTSGKATADVFREQGINLVKVDNNMFNGCMRMKEWLYAPEDGQAKLTILEDSAPNLYRCLTKIQKDKNKANVYAKTPHELTHSVDSLRYFCVFWTLPADASLKNNHKKWTDDMWEDYKHSSETEKQYLLEKWGDPK